MNALIFGANGQDGFYLGKLLTQYGIRVHSVSRSAGFLQTNIADPGEVAELVKQVQPDFIFHFAANSTTRHDALFENNESISGGTLCILEAVKNFSPATKVFISGSALQFLNTGVPINESAPFAPNNAYAVSRIQSVYAARYFRSLGLQVYVGYFFNHDSSYRTERHMAKKISEAARRIAAGSDERLAIGDLDVVKEWSYAGDIVKAVWLLVSQSVVFEAVIGSGEGFSVMEWADACFKEAGLVAVDYIDKSEGFISPYACLVSDNSLIKAIGYRPEVSFAALARKMVKNEE